MILKEQMIFLGLDEVKNQISETGTWTPNFQELQWGSKGIMA